MSSKENLVVEGVARFTSFKIAPCTCKSEYQDAKYGKGMRVFTGRFPSGKLSGWRCTVCGKTISLGGEQR
jgi:transposase-like protein